MDEQSVEKTLESTHEPRDVPMPFPLGTVVKGRNRQGQEVIGSYDGDHHHYDLPKGEHTLLVWNDRYSREELASVMGEGLVKYDGLYPPERSDKVTLISETDPKVTEAWKQKGFETFTDTREESGLGAPKGNLEVIPSDQVLVASDANQNEKTIELLRTWFDLQEEWEQKIEKSEMGPARDILVAQHAVLSDCAEALTDLFDGEWKSEKAS